MDRKEERRYEFFEVLVGPDRDLLTFYFTPDPTEYLEGGYFLPGNPVDHRHRVYGKKLFSADLIRYHRDYGMKIFYTGPFDPASNDDESTTPHLILLCKKCSLRIVLPEKKLSETNLVMHLKQRYAPVEIQ